VSTSGSGTVCVGERREESSDTIIMSGYIGTISV
jgi:hypothetical protein